MKSGNFSVCSALLGWEVCYAPGTAPGVGCTEVDETDVAPTLRGAHHWVGVGNGGR